MFVLKRPSLFDIHVCDIFVHQSEVFFPVSRLLLSRWSSNTENVRLSYFLLNRHLVLFSVSFFSPQCLTMSLIFEWWLNESISVKGKYTLSPLSEHSLTGRSLTGQKLVPVNRTPVIRTKKDFVRITSPH